MPWGRQHHFLKLRRPGYPPGCVGVVAGSRLEETSPRLSGGRRLTVAPHSASCPEVPGREAFKRLRLGKRSRGLFKQPQGAFEESSLGPCEGFQHRLSDWVSQQ